jgi:hypothetical protein
MRSTESDAIRKGAEESSQLNSITRVLARNWRAPAQLEARDGR